MTSELTDLAVSVYDGVFAPEDLARLDALTPTDQSDTSVIDRRRFDAGDQQPTQLQAALLALVAELGDDRRYIEYWWRRPAMSVPVHRDIDEEPSADGRQRCPMYGHVLYVSLEPGLRAPTCLWEELAHPPAPATSDRAGGPLGPLQSLVAVPAVEGRLLRFRGDLSHSVAAPALEYLHGDDFVGEARRLVSLQLAVFADLLELLGVATPPPPPKRVVLLFNTWEEHPGAGAANGSAVFDLQGRPRAAAELVAGGAAAAAAAQGADTPRPLAPARFAAWRRSAVVNLTAGGAHGAAGGGRGAAARVLAQMMGDEERRGGLEAETVEARALDAAALRAALGAASTVHRVEVASPPPGEAVVGLVAQAVAHAVVLSWPAWAMLLLPLLLWRPKKQKPA